MNRVVLVGRLTADPQLRYTPNGVAVATFTLAVNRAFSKEKEADFLNIVVWKKQAENASNYLKKGSLAGVDGRLQTRNYEGQDGKKVYVTEVVAESVQFLDTKQKQEDKPAQRYTADPADPFAGGGSIDITDEDLPF